MDEYNAELRKAVAELIIDSFIKAVGTKFITSPYQFPISNFTQQQ